MAHFITRSLAALSAVAVLSAPLLTTAAQAAGFDVNATTTDLALRGVDPVSYFAMGKPVEGAVDITAKHNGAVYRFASEDNKALFTANPEKYAPQFGGYCAFAAGKGFKFDGDPDVWAIVDDKLYLNVSAKVGEIFKKDAPALISQATTKWPEIKDADPATVNP